MLQILIGVAVALIILSLFKKNVPGTPPMIGSIPLIGCFHKFATDPLGLVRKSYDKVGDAFTLYLMGFKMTFLIGPEAQSVFFRGSDEELSPKEAYRFVTPVFGPGVVYDSPTEVMYEQLRFVKDGLVLSQLKKSVGIISEETEKFFEEKWGDSGEVDLLAEMNKLTILTASRCLMGSDINKALGQASNLADLYHELEEGLNPISFFFPNLPLPSFAKRDAARAKVAAIFDSIIKARRRSTEPRDDVLQVLMTSKYKDGSVLDDEKIVGLMIGLLFAGQHTSSITSTWAGFYMFNNPEYLEQVLKEINDYHVEENNGEINFDGLRKMTRLETIIREVLRLHPPLIFLMRKVMEPITYKDFTIPAGHLVAVSPAVGMRLDSVFKNANEFNPKRFDPENDESKTPFSYIAFGGGKHGCPGENFGILQIKTIWSVLLQKYDLKLGSVPKPDYTNLVAGPQAPCKITYTRKQKYFNKYRFNPNPSFYTN
ncbi:cytochrome P450 family protein [Heterostelium album PN500]|uniref:Cytochrome P450 family protein n=1 Tax=Heterostelium pallidum (strain ATCC 26659 / Pp 5 / PN500) TaxID=670386 RepID=D3BF70_HETP5|nr:cytochrome P450 family protein [Heterostelium album PN500]EFA79784.1 cytochrome P450 family protein [Heterostelium album PN500]|eukprot:XP_020431905.1 cytochrome P450 family protein [Heterostelium album PN500]